MSSSLLHTISNILCSQQYIQYLTLFPANLDPPALQNLNSIEQNNFN